MRIFLSYASEDRPLAEQVQLSLVGEGHEVFFDVESLPPGGDYQSRIRDAVGNSECLIFLISPESVEAKSYALTELGFARAKWSHPKGRVVPVIGRDTDFDSIPAYLKAVTILEPKGNLAAEVVSAIAKLHAQSTTTYSTKQRNPGHRQEQEAATLKVQKLGYFKDVLVAVITLVGGVLTAVLGASWFTPDILRLDVFFPTKEVQILDDFVFVHFESYSERSSGRPIETYENPYTKLEADVFDKATYVEHVWLRKTKGEYTIRLTTTGTAPEIRAISPPLKAPRYELTPSGSQIMTADMALDQSSEFNFSGITPNPKIVYIYRNGFQERNSFGGKNVAYATDRLTFVYDFSSLRELQTLFQVAPKACLKRSQEERPIPLDLKWDNGVAITEAFALKQADKVRIFWTWNRLIVGSPSFPPVTCDDALR